ncbi:hypothetical protein BV22DRAFT_562128 [Leucogyrophana mollusca]|uniref:Uncharacterized protein n=1 Tax=Leucogyrophana mollusca TaxID=85980 RepID=A0ACB8BE11_9AGAM|nr:hypothetical protein BV22DRAFT_562128 [Leucogyrophana mollusca]
MLSRWTVGFTATQLCAAPRRQSTPFFGTATNLLLCLACPNVALFVSILRRRDKKTVRSLLKRHYSVLPCDDSHHRLAVFKERLYQSGFLMPLTGYTFSLLTFRSVMHAPVSLICCSSLLTDGDYCPCFIRAHPIRSGRGVIRSFTDQIASLPSNVLSRF